MVPNEIVTEIKSLHHAITQRVDELDAQQKKLGEELTSKTATMPTEYKESFEKLNGRVNELMEKVEQARIEAQRPQLGEKGKEISAERKAFLKAIRNGGTDGLTMEEKSLIMPAYMPAEKKALYAGDATTGGFFASTDFVEELQAYKLLISPMRSICRTMKTSSERVQMPALANDTSAYWSTEQASFTDSTNASVSMLTIPVHELRGLVRISQQNLEDSMFDLEGFIKQRLGLKFAQTEGTAFVSGSGAGQPQGITGYAIKASSGYTGGSAAKNNVVDAVPYVASGQAANITADSVLNVLMDLKSYYEPNATYLFTRATLNTIRLFKDSQNRPLWQPFAGGNLPATIYNRPYVEMPDVDEIAANKYPIIVGDFSHYLIVDRVTMNLQQLNELYAASGLVGFIARQRVGGQILLPEAFRLLKCSVS